MLRKFSSLAFCAMLTVCAAASAQEFAEPAKASTEPTQVSLNADGELIGRVFADVDGEKKPVEAKMTLIREGVTVKSVYADETGNFSFGNVAPGKYAVSGSAANYVGMQPVAVTAPAAAAPVAANSFVLSAPSYSSFSPAASCNSCSGGGYGGGFGGGGRFLGGNRRLLRLGIIGGIIGGVVGGSDTSPDGTDNF